LTAEHNNGYFLSVSRKAGVTAEQTKGRLVDAAAQVFAERGYEGARVSEIARSAGVTTGAIYAHYENKSDLLCEAIRSHGSDALAALLSSEGGPPLAEMLIALGASLPYRDADDGCLLVEAVVASRRDVGVAQFLRRDVASREAIVARLVHAAQSRGELDPTAPTDAVARLCTTLALGSLVIKALHLEGPDPEDWTAVIRRLVGSIQPEEGQ
jgi:AcrR family transcriptional regulator